MGRVGFQGLQDFAKKHGGDTLGEEELKSIFRDFQPDGGNLITVSGDPWMASTLCHRPEQGRTKIRSVLP